MGFWGKLAGIGLGAAGVITGNPALIGAGVGVYGASNASDASKKANEQQQQATNQALTTQTQMYERGMSGLSPFINLGTGAAGMLSQGLGLPSQAGSPAAPGPMSSLMTPNKAVPKEPAAQEPATAVPMVGKLSPWANRQADPVSQQTQSSYARMFDPNGRMVSVPAEMVQQALQQGGRMA